MASFGATLKLRLDKAEVDQGLDRVVTSARQVGDKLEGSMARATTATKKFGQALEPVIQQGLMRIADFGIDQLVEGFRVMGEESVVISNMFTELKELRNAPFKGAAQQIDEDFGGGTTKGLISARATQLQGVGSLVAGAGGQLKAGEWDKAIGQLAGAWWGMVGEGVGLPGVAGPRGRELQTQEATREVDLKLEEIAKEMRELNAKTPDPND